MSDVNFNIEASNPINIDIGATNPINFDIGATTPVSFEITGPVVGSVSIDEGTFWMSLARGFKGGTEPTLNASQPAGAEVYDYTYDTAAGGTTTRYRYIADDGSIDAFYTGWDGATATGLLARKRILL